MRHVPPFLPAVILGAGLVLAGCATAPPPVPPPQAEVLPLPPVTATPLIWRPGHWDWNGGGYAWVPGAYVPRGDHSNEWLPGHWVQQGAGWAWVPAHWL